MLLHHRVPERPVAVLQQLHGLHAAVEFRLKVGLDGRGCHEQQAVERRHVEGVTVGAKADRSHVENALKAVLNHQLAVRLVEHPHGLGAWLRRQPVVVVLAQDGLVQPRVNEDVPENVQDLHLVRDPGPKLSQIRHVDLLAVREEPLIGAVRRRCEALVLVRLGRDDRQTGELVTAGVDQRAVVEVLLDQGTDVAVRPRRVTGPHLVRSVARLGFEVSVSLAVHAFYLRVLLHDDDILITALLQLCRHMDARRPAADDDDTRGGRILDVRRARGQLQILSWYRVRASTAFAQATAHRLCKHACIRRVRR
mmetsp:Transcript_24310/g.61957  ORF Transcript_24310/g.61957 Transcript_24310/m.61957 type:complete len:309 (-) Transcript_24310:57-983(-)